MKLKMRKIDESWDCYQLNNRTWFVKETMSRYYVSEFRDGDSYAQVVYNMLDKFVPDFVKSEKSQLVFMKKTNVLSGLNSVNSEYFHLFHKSTVKAFNKGV